MWKLPSAAERRGQRAYCSRKRTFPPQFLLEIWNLRKSLVGREEITIQKGCVQCARPLRIFNCTAGLYGQCFFCRLLLKRTRGNELLGERSRRRRKVGEMCLWCPDERAFGQKFIAPFRSNRCGIGENEHSLVFSRLPSRKAVRA